VVKFEYALKNRFFKVNSREFMIFRDHLLSSTVVPLVQTMPFCTFCSIIAEPIVIGIMPTKMRQIVTEEMGRKTILFLYGNTCLYSIYLKDKKH
jgi:hypothetical protein